MHTHVHSGIIHNSQKVEATQVSINGWSRNKTRYRRTTYQSTLKRKKMQIRNKGGFLTLIKNIYKKCLYPFTSRWKTLRFPIEIRNKTRMSPLTTSFWHYIGTHSLCSKRQKKETKEIRKKKGGKEGKRERREQRGRKHKREISGKEKNCLCVAWQSAWALINQRLLDLTASRL